MAKRVARRHGVREIEQGKRKGLLHVAPASYKALCGEMAYLEMYLSERDSAPTA